MAIRALLPSRQRLTYPYREACGSNVESYRHGGVNQEFLDEFGVDVALEEQGGAGVSKIVEGNGGRVRRALGAERTNAGGCWRG